MPKDKKRFEQSARTGASEISEAEIDQNLMGTFPASDPPSRCIMSSQPVLWRRSIDALRHH